MVSERCALLEGSVSEPFPSGSLGQGQGTWGREGHRGRGPEGNVAVSQGQGWGACWGVKAAGSESSWGVGGPIHDLQISSKCDGAIRELRAEGRQELAPVLKTHAASS